MRTCDLRYTGGSGKEPEMTESQERSALDKMDHVAITVTNVAATVQWYQQKFHCRVVYQDPTWALLEFANIRLAFVVSSQHPSHFAILGDPKRFGTPKPHRDGTTSVYIQDPEGNNIEILELAKQTEPTR